MAESITLARPYAKAVFGLAQEQKQFAEWSEQLLALSAVVTSQELALLIGSPKVSSAELVNLIADVAAQVGGQGAASVADEAKRLLGLMAENDRLSALPDVAAQYEILRNEAEKVVDAEMRSATQPTDAQQEAVRASLAKRLGRDVKLTVVIDESLVGGALVRAGDLVIDGTVKTKLARLETALTNA